MQKRHPQPATAPRSRHNPQGLRPPKIAKEVGPPRSFSFPSPVPPQRSRHGPLAERTIRMSDPIPYPAKSPVQVRLKFVLSTPTAYCKAPSTIVGMQNRTETEGEFKLSIGQRNRRPPIEERIAVHRQHKGKQIPQRRGARSHRELQTGWLPIDRTRLTTNRPTLRSTNRRRQPTQGPQSL